MKNDIENRFEASKSFGEMGFGYSGKVITDTENSKKTPST